MAAAIFLLPAVLFPIMIANHEPKLCNGAMAQKWHDRNSLSRRQNLGEQNKIRMKLKSVRALTFGQSCCRYKVGGMRMRSRRREQNVRR